MRDCNQGRFRRQVNFFRRQLLQDGQLPFGDILNERSIELAMQAAGEGWIDRIYTPMVTLWVFLGQVFSADHSCRAAVARLIAHRVSQGQAACSARTGAYCQARKRLTEKFFSSVARQVGQTLDSRAEEHWLWKGHRVYAFDGSTVTMPDTAENQAAYPQNVVQKPGLGFPIARIAAIFSLSCGAVVDLGICRYAGKGQGELSVFRQLWSFFCPGDIVLADRLYCTWLELLTLRQRGVDSVTQLHVMRRADFRKGKRLGKGDHIVRWPKPTTLRSVDWQTYKALPEFLTVRECHIPIKQSGFRTKSILVVTTLLDAERYSREDLAELYRARWNAELDLRSLKETLQMDILRCKSPELARKEIWTHILAYNLIRTVMAQAATEYELQPRTISFKGALQTLEAFGPVIAIQGQQPRRRKQLYESLLYAAAQHRVADRPDRFEPRVRKRRPKKYPRMRLPRHEIKELMAKGLVKI